MNAERRKALNAACESLREAAALWEDLKGKIEDAKSIIETARDEEQEYRDAMPDSIAGGEKGDRADEAIATLDDAMTDLDAVDEFDPEDIISKVEAAL